MKNGYGIFWILQEIVALNILQINKDFLIFNTNDFHADTKALYKIRKITGMTFIQIIERIMRIVNYGFIDYVFQAYNNEVSWDSRSSYIKNDNRTFKEGRECSY